MKKQAFVSMVMFFVLLTAIFLNGCGGGGSTNDTTLKPVAEFTVSLSGGGIEPSAGQINDASLNSPTNWEWYVDGVMKKAGPWNSFTWDFNTAGTYIVKLIVSNSAGSDTITHNVVVTARKFVTSPGAFVYAIEKNGNEIYMAIEKDKNVTMAKYSTDGTKILEKQILTAVAVDDGYFCQNIFTRNSDNIHLYGVCVKEFSAWANKGMRTGGEIRLLKFRKDDLTVVNSSILAAELTVDVVAMNQADDFFYLIGSNVAMQYLIKFDFDGNDLATRATGFNMLNMEVTADAVFMGGTISQSGTRNRLCVRKVSKDLGTEIWESHYRNFEDTTDVDDSHKGMMTITSNGIFMTGTLDSSGYLSFPKDPTIPQPREVLLRWDMQTGIITLVKTFAKNKPGDSVGEIISDQDDKLYVALYEVNKLNPDGINIILPNKITRFGEGIPMFIDGNNLLISTRLGYYEIYNRYTFERIN